MNSQSKSQSWAKVLRWVARIWSIPAILFVVAHLFSPDTNGGAEVFWYEWLAVGTMSASVFALLLGWWREKIGGWASLGLLVIFMAVYGIYARELFPGWWIVLIGIAIPAILFLVVDRIKLTQTSSLAQEDYKA